MDKLKLFMMKAKKNKTKLHSQIFTKYLLSYLIAFLLPLLVMGMLLNYYYFNVLEMEVKKNNSNLLSHTKNVIDADISQLNVIAYQIYRSPKLTAYQMANNILDTKQGLQELKNYIAGNRFIDEILLYDQSLGRIYSSSNSLTESEFLDIYSNYGWTQKKLLKTTDMDYNSIMNIGISINEESVSKQVAFITPDQIWQDRVVFFFINLSYLKTLLENQKGNTIIFDDSSLLIAAHKYENYINSEQLRSLVQSDKETDFITVSIENVSYFVSYIKSNETGWLYMTVIPSSEAMEKVIQVKQVFQYGIFVLLLAAVVLISYVMRMNYNPIKNLKTFAETILGQSSNTTNEIEFVRLTIDQISKSRAEINSKLEKNHDAIKEFIILTLLKGEFSDINEFNEKAREVDIQFSNTCFQVAIFSCLNFQNDKLLEWKEIIADMESNLPDGMEGYGKLSEDNNKVIFIFAINTEDEGVMRRYLEHLQNYLYSDWRFHVTIGVGNLCERIDQIGRSYIEASTAIDYRLIKGNNRIIFFNEIVITTSVVQQYPQKELIALETAITEGDVTNIDNIIVAFIDTIKKTDMPLFMAKCLCFDIINTIIKTMYRVNKRFLSQEREYPDVIAMAEFETVEELGENIRRISLDICEYIKKNQDSHIENLTDQLIVFIKENYCSHSFSIQVMADSFGMSLSYLGQYFKQQTGQTISEYVNYLKIEKAKQLLLTTSMTIHEVIDEIGYCDTSSFVRKFKNIVGTTPGLFRKINQHEKV